MARAAKAIHENLCKVYCTFEKRVRVVVKKIKAWSERVLWQIMAERMMEELTRGRKACRLASKSSNSTSTGSGESGKTKKVETGSKEENQQS
jgi:hypothetical protein